VEMKADVVRVLGELGHQVIDDGAPTAEPSDYPDFARVVAGKVREGLADRGILICGTGIGMCSAANKVPGRRAAVVHDAATADISRRHNDLNVLCLDSNLQGKQDLTATIQAFLTSPFDGGRHERRVNKICEIEKSVHDGPAHRLGGSVCEA